MHLPNTLIASVSLGLLTCLGGTALAEGGSGSGDPRVVIVEQPAESSYIGNFSFSDDGELRLFHVYEHSDSDIYRYENDEWTLIRRELWVVVPGITPIDVSTDGSVLLMTDFSRTDIRIDGAIYTMSKQWAVEDDQGRTSHVWGRTVAGHVSSNGEVVTLKGISTNDRNPGSDSLAWFGGSDVISISNGLPRGDGISY